MENIENLLNIYEQLRSCTNPDDVETLKKSLNISNIQSKEVEKDGDRDSCKNGGSKELGIRNVGKSRWLSVADKSREVDNLIKEAKELAKIGKFGEYLTIEVHEEMQVQFPISNLVGDKFDRYILEITDLLTNNKAWTIGVWGMGGVGKTTLIKKLHNMMLDEPQIYGSVYWITASKDCTIQKLQNDIAKKIRESMSDELDESQRAGILIEALKRKKKFVLILDDIWSNLDLNEVGLGFPKEIGYQLIVTSRSKDVCLMYCDNIIKVDPLSPKDAWTLFVRSIRREIPDDLTKVSIDVLKECGGLPLGIITLAKSMIGCNDMCEWRNVLHELKTSSKIDDMEEKVFNVLRWSYERLKDRKIKECLLYCATYPEDYPIEINELIWLFIDAGLLGKNVGMAKMFDKGLSILRKLERVALLSIEIVSFVEGEMKYVRLHDLIRDMALQIAGSRFMIKDGVGLKCIPDEESWTTELEVASLMRSEIVKISNLSPKCNSLSALLFQYNTSLGVVRDGFFRYLDGLKLLNLSYSCIKDLPKSISLLKNLTALILMRCRMLENVSSLAELRSLERLNLCETNISQLPKGIGSLIKLRYLNLYFTRIERIGVGDISKLTALQYLAIGARIDVNELNSLNNLEHLTAFFEDFVSFSKFVQQMKIKGRPNFYTFFVGKFSHRSSHPIEVAGGTWRLKQIYLRKTKIDLYDIVQRNTFGKDRSGYSIVDDILVLDIHDDKNVMSLGDYVFDCACNVQRQSRIERGSKPFSNLQWLELHNCPNLKKLFPLGLLSNLQDLEEINIRSCEGLEELIEEAPDETKLVGITNPKTFSLPKLEYIRLENLPNLKRLCRDDEMIRIPLQKITILRCPKLKRMPLDLDKILQPLPQMYYYRHEIGWLEKLEWDPPESRSKMQFMKY